MKKVFKIELFEASWRKDMDTYHQLNEQDLENAKITWVNALVGLTKEEMTEEQQALVRDEWFA